MYLQFPDLHCYRLALTSGAIPAELAMRPVQGAHQGGEVVITPKSRLADSHRDALQALGVIVRRGTPDAPLCEWGCWPELLPLEPTGQPAALDGATVMFEVPPGPLMAAMAAEMLRLGNDRQAFRLLREGDRQSTLLRVVSPPYYTLLRALDAQSPTSSGGVGPRLNREQSASTATASSPGTTSEACLAYVEQAPRVWVQLGYRHPLGERITPPPGQLVLLGPPDRWRRVNEGPFRDIYELAEFQLPATGAVLETRTLDQALTIPLRMEPCTDETAAELWVLTTDPEGQLQSLVSAADERLLARLAFAVVTDTSGNASHIVLRARPHRDGPPALVLNATAYRSYQKISHLFVPVGRRLRPLLRRDAVTRLLAADPQQITWLAPMSSRDERPSGPASRPSAGQREVGPGGRSETFTPHRINEDAFQPLDRWVEYLVDHESQALDCWLQSHRFDFETYTCDDGRQRPGGGRPIVPPALRAPAEEVVNEPGDAWEPDRQSAPESAAMEDANNDEPDAELHSQFEPREAETEPARETLRRLEAEFQASSAAHDSVERSWQWRRLAEANQACDQSSEVTGCWARAVWELAASESGNGETEPQAADWLNEWYRSECRSTQLELGTPEQLAALLEGGGQRPAHAALLCSCLAWLAARGRELPAELLSRSTRWLESHEGYLPLRVVWLGWHGLARLAGNDVLALARSRDRLLERLHRFGLRAELDIPSFLSAASGGASERLQTVGPQLPGLQTAVREWVVESRAEGDPQTLAYADLLLAFGFARTGQADAARRITAMVARQFEGKDALHQWLRQALEYRIESVLQGLPTDRGELSLPVREALEQLDRVARYKADRILRDSTLLKPSGDVAVYERYVPQRGDHDILALEGIRDPDELQEALEGLVEGTGSANNPASERSRWLAALDHAPRVGESFGLQLASRALQRLEAELPVAFEAGLIAKTAYLAGHFGNSSLQQRLSELLLQRLPGYVAHYLTPPTRLSTDDRFTDQQALEVLFSESFIGLRKLGMRDEMLRLFETLATLLEQRGLGPTASGSAPPGRRTGGTGGAEDASAERLWLFAAGGCFYFGRLEAGLAITDRVRDQLFAGRFDAKQQTNLARHYSQVLGLAPTEAALPRLLELFELNQFGRPRLPRITDEDLTSTHLAASCFRLVEAVVLSLVGMQLEVAPETRLWMDEDEFLVRRRLHRDLQCALEDSAVRPAGLSGGTGGREP